MRQRGFSLIETCIAMACALLLIFGASTLATQSMRHHQHALGKISSIEQNSEIKDLIFSLANSTSCMARTGLSSAPAFNPANDKDLPLTGLQTNSDVTINRLFLTRAKLLRTSGINSEYSAELKITQTLVRSPAAIAPVTLGLMRLVVNSSGNIVSCNWDDTFIDPMTVCAGTTAVSANFTCYTAPIIPIVLTCPTGTSLTNGHCIPSDIDCFNQSLSTAFDGVKLGCTVIPTTKAIRYPAGYTPPPEPTLTQPVAGAPPETVTIPAQPCQCGSQSIQPGSTQLCSMAWSVDDSFFGNGSAYDDMWQVKRCNSAGQLEGNAPNEYIFRENGRGVQWAWRISSCTTTTGSKNVDGRRYSLGGCQ